VAQKLMGYFRRLAAKSTGNGKATSKTFAGPSGLSISLPDAESDRGQGVRMLPPDALFCRTAARQLIAAHRSAGRLFIIGSDQKQSETCQ